MGSIEIRYYCKGYLNRTQRPMVAVSCDSAGKEKFLCKDCVKHQIKMLTTWLESLEK